MSAPGGRVPPPRHEVALMEGYHSPQLDVEVRINTNEAPEPPPAAYLEALAAEIGKLSFNRYPDRSASRLREAIAEHHGVRAEEVFCANGSNEVLQCLLLAYGGPGRAVGLFEPTYALHAHIARITGTEVIEGERDEDFFVDRAQLERVLAEGASRLLHDGRDQQVGAEPAVNPVVVFLASPNNPTGRLEPEELVDEVLARAPGLVVIDEAYGQFAPRSALELRPQHRNLVVVRTFSKTWSLAGLRLGYAIADEAVVAAMERVVLPYHLDAFKQLAGRLALDYDAEMRARVARLVEQRGRLVAALLQLGCKVVPSDANFVLFSTGDHDAKALWKALVERSVLVRDVSSWPRLSGYLRVSVGTPEENDRFLSALGAVLGQAR